MTLTLTLTLTPRVRPTIYHPMPRPVSSQVQPGLALPEEACYAMGKGRAVQLHHTQTDSAAAHSARRGTPSARAGRPRAAASDS